MNTLPPIPSDPLRNRWYFADVTSKKTQGPLTLDKLQCLATIGEIKPETLVCEEGGTWKKYGEVARLLPPPIPDKPQSAPPKLPSPVSRAASGKAPSGCLWLGLGVLFLAVVCSLINSGNTPESRGVIVQTNTKIPIKSRIEKTMNDLFGRTLKKVKVTPHVDGGYLVQVEFKESVITPGWAREAIEYEMQQAYEKLYAASDLEIRRASVAAVVGFHDKFGNESEDIAYKTVLDADVAKKINWENISSVNFTEVWQTTYLAPEFQTSKDRK